MGEGLLNEHKDPVRRLKFMVAEIKNCTVKVTSFSHELLVHLTDKSYIINSQFCLALIYYTEVKLTLMYHSQ